MSNDSHEGDPVAVQVIKTTIRLELKLRANPRVTDTFKHKNKELIDCKANDKK